MLSLDWAGVRDGAPPHLSRQVRVACSDPFFWVPWALPPLIGLPYVFIFKSYITSRMEFSKSTQMSRNWTRILIFTFERRDIRSEESIAIIKNFDFDYLWISIPLYINHFKKMSIYLPVCLCDSRRTLRLNQFTDIVQIRYLVSSANIQGILFLIFPYL